MITRARSKQKQSARTKLNQLQAPRKLPFIEHIYELRKRLFSVAVSVLVFSVAAYFVQQHIVNALLAPAKDQQFIYTTPGGGIDFLFRVCLYTGIIFSIPVIVHQLLKYLEPLIKKDAVSFIARGSIASGFLAVGGILFGYFLGLPAALHFLQHQFTNSHIEAMLSIQSYMSFVMLYMMGAAMIFQLPLILLLINRIKPLQPKKLLGAERWVILLSFIAGGIISPSPSIMDQLLLAGPMIITYQVGIVLVWFVNRKHRRPKRVAELLKKDAELRAARIRQFQAAHETWRQTALNHSTKAVPRKPLAVAQPKPKLAVAAPPSVATQVAPVSPAPSTRAGRPAQNRRYLDEFQRRPYFASASRVQ